MYCIQIFQFLWENFRFFDSLLQGEYTACIELLFT